MSFDFTTLVTDRTQSDVQRVRSVAAKIINGTASAAEIAEWNAANMKGAYNYTDLNRVTAAMEALKAKLEGYGYAVPGYQRIKVPHVLPEPEPTSRLPEGYLELTYIESSGTQYCSIPPVNTTGDFELAFDVTPVQYATWSCLLTNIGKGGIWVGKVNTGTFSLRTYSGSNHVNATLPELNKRLSVGVKCVTGTSSLYLNGISQGTASVAYTETAKCALLSDGGSGTFIGRLYSCQIYESGVLVRNFVPCINPNGEVGLYDTATKAFFGNAGTGSFIAGSAVDIVLPSGYKRVEYIESSGTQYVDTGVYLTGNSKVVLDFEPTYGGSWNKIFGSNIKGEYFCLWIDTNRIYCYYAGGYQHFVGATGRFTFVADGNVWTDGATTATLTAANFVATQTALLFNINSGGNYPLATMKLYSCKIHNNGTLVRDFVPCINPSNEAGLYDMVNGVFYKNAGTGTFATGYIIPSPSQPIVIDPYTWHETDIPTPELMAAHLANVSAIRSVLDMLPTTPAVPADMEQLTTDKANAIERILADINTLIQNMIAAWFYSGEIYSGEV